ncbi:hypothetical protein B0H13DRAFT_2363191 [Mycena leptocephala]|nr:hypothetical protein B0H13DRAFT_2363191 [Mycena leptocephala]
MYEGRTAAQAGIVFGHEKYVDLKLIWSSIVAEQTTHSMGIVDEVGSGVTLLKKGDRVVMPFDVACGRCLNREEGKSAFCTLVNPGFAGGAYGYVAMRPYPGGQGVRAILVTSLLCLALWTFVTFKILREMPRESSSLELHGA